MLKIRIVSYQLDLNDGGIRYLEHNANVVHNPIYVGHVLVVSRVNIF